MSPEQIAGGRTAIDARTDVFSLGATLYEALTLQRPFRGDTTAQVFRQVLWKEPVRPRRLNPGIPADLETVCLKALEKDPEHRYATAGLFAEDLKSLLELRPIRARPAGPITRTTKWVRRNRPAAAAIVVVAASLFASVGFFAQGEWAKRTEIRGELARAGQHVEQRRYDAALECVARVLVLAPGHPTAVRLKTEIQGKMAGEALEEAQATIEEFRRGAREESELSPEALNLRVEQTVAAIPANQQEGLLKLENILSRKRLDLETLFYSALEKLNRAGRLAPNDPLRARLLADLYVERLRELDGRGDVEASRFFTGLLRRYHPDRFLEEEIKNRGSVAFVTNPPGAQVFLFRYVERSEFIEGGEPRLVPVPFDGQGASFPYPPGTWALRVARGAGSIERQDLLFTVGGFPIRETVLATEANEKLGIRPFDRLVSIDGHPIRDEHEVRQWGVDYEHKFALAQPYAALPPRRFEMERAGEGRFHFDLRSATDVGVEFRVARHIAEIGGVEAEVYHLGELRTAALQPGLEVRPTAAPLLLCSRSDFGTTPTDVRSLRSGSYLALVRLAAYEDLRLPFFLRRDCESVIELDLLPEGTSPEGFVYIPPGAWIGGGDPDTVASEPLEERTSEEFWMMEREMTACDYLPFLNDEVIVARRLASPIAILAPREEIQTSWDGEVWRECRRPDGRYELPERVLEQTLQGISWHDAKEYAEWRTRRAALEGDRFVFELPTHEEWEKAARGADGRSFVFGNRFVPWWSSTRTARRQHTRHDPMSFPVDESPFGVFDLGGNQSEWCIPSLDRYGNPFHTRGGSHINPRPSDFRLAGRNDELPGNVRTYIGFRLVARLRQ
jgi:formylglycine-generating enzyme required for sulfatase activity